MEDRRRIGKKNQASLFFLLSTFLIFAAVIDTNT